MQAVTPPPIPVRETPLPTVSRRSFFNTALAGASLAGLAKVSTPSVAAATPPPATADFADPLYHFLNRISWSVRSQDLARLGKLGQAAYLEEQLSPRLVGASDRVTVHPALRLSRKEIIRRYKKDPYYTSYIALVTGMIARAVQSPAQLYERVVEFWSDHFNVAAQDLAPEVVDWQRTVIRRFAFTKFRTLLQASARHPAMLFYLNNSESTREHPNENYARELMELHTLGVGSGYTEDDVKAVARVFTGWSADYTKLGGFIFDEYAHDQEDKTVLGHLIAGQSGKAGLQEGVAVLNLLADDPRTHKFVLRKLCTRFISDAYAKPGEAELSVINRLTVVWQQTDGDIKAILRALFALPEFAAAPLQKLRRPLEFFVACQRATGSVYQHFWGLESQIELLDQVPYGWGPPDGYPDVATPWASTSGILARWAVAQELASSALPEGEWSDAVTHFQVPLKKAKTVGELLGLLSQRFLGASLPAETTATLIAFATEGAGSAETLIDQDFRAQKLGPLAGLILSLPQFQWR